MKERYPSVVYYVAAPGYPAVYFDGPHGLWHALHFADIARQHGFVEVKIGAGRGQPLLT